MKLSFETDTDLTTMFPKHFVSAGRLMPHPEDCGSRAVQCTGEVGPNPEARQGRWQGAPCTTRSEVVGHTHSSCRALPPLGLQGAAEPFCCAAGAGGGSCGASTDWACATTALAMGWSLPTSSAAATASTSSSLTCAGAPPALCHSGRCSAWQLLLLLHPETAARATLDLRIASEGYCLGAVGTATGTH